MAKLMTLFCIALLIGAVISAVPERITRGRSALRTTPRPSSSCGRHGDPCVSASQCCNGLRCHSYANRCQVIITQEEILAQREKILGRRGPDQ